MKNNKEREEENIVKQQINFSHIGKNEQSEEILRPTIL